MRPVYGSFARPAGRTRPDLQVGFCGRHHLPSYCFSSPVQRAYRDADGFSRCARSTGIPISVLKHAKRGGGVGGLPGGKPPVYSGLRPGRSRRQRGSRTWNPVAGSVTSGLWSKTDGVRWLGPPAKIAPGFLPLDGRLPSRERMDLRPLCLLAADGTSAYSRRSRDRRLGPNAIKRNRRSATSESGDPPRRTRTPNYSVPSSDPLRLCVIRANQRVPVRFPLVFCLLFRLSISSGTRLRRRISPRRSRTCKPAPTCP